MYHKTRRCTYLKGNGHQCSANAMSESTHCFFHSPHTREERTAARRAGGLERSRRTAVLPPGTPDWPIRRAADVLALLADTASRVRRGELDQRIASTVGSLCSVMLHALDAGDVEERLSALERVIKATVQPIEAALGPGLAETTLD